MHACSARRVEIRRAQPEAESFRHAPFPCVQRVPHSAIAHVSVSPPLIPDGRISRVRLAASALHAFSPQSLPLLTEASVHAHLHPASVWLTVPRAQGSVYHSHRPSVLPWGHPYGRSLSREPLRLFRGLPLGVSHGLRHRSTFLDPLGSYGLMRQANTLPSPPCVALCHASVQVAASPCGELALPDVLSSLFLWVRGPVPRRASPVRLLVASRTTSASPQSQQVRRAGTSLTIATALMATFFGAAVML
jgi:hypothetical protein